MRRTSQTIFSVLLIAFLSLSVSFCKKPDIPEPQDDPTETPTDPTDPTDPTEPEVILVSSLTIGPEEDIVLEVGQEKQLSCTVLPEDAADKRYSWKSDHPEFVTVDDKGLVKAVAVGEANISAVATDNGITATKLVTVYKPQAQSFTSIEILSPTHLDSHFEYQEDAEYGKNICLYFRLLSDRMQLSARGLPADANDELEFINGSHSLAFDVSEDGLITPCYGCGMKSSSDFRNHYVLIRSKKNPKVSVKVFIKCKGDNAERLILFDDDFPKSFIHPGSGDGLLFRYSNYIGKNATRSFDCFVVRSPLENPSLSSYTYEPEFTIVSSSGPVTFVKEGEGLKATVNSGTRASTLDNTVEASVTVRVNGYEQTFPFVVSMFDPLFPKVGDGIESHKEGYLDCGYRGNGIYEALPYKAGGYHVNALIAYLGSAPMSDPIYKDYCKGGIRGTGTTVYHGIAVPVNTGRLYRSTKTNGEIFSTDYDTLQESDSWPTSWFSPNWILYSNTRPSAFANTCAMVYRNRWCGKSHDTKPANFFVDEELFVPSAADKAMTVSGFDWESDFYGSLASGNLKSTGDPFNAKEKYLDTKAFRTPWLWPTLQDLSYLFQERSFDVSKLHTTTVTSLYSTDMEKKVELLQVCARRFGGAKPEYYYKYWVSQVDDLNSKAPLVTISKGQISAKMVYRDNVEAYVLPIAYF